MSHTRRCRDGHRTQPWTTFESMANGCRSKVPYTSRGKAAGALRVMLRDHPRDNDHLNTYKCRCGYWHLGNSNRRSQRPTDLERLVAHVLRPFLTGELTP